ncbi:protein of unknown function [Pseudomonas sp. JV241A]|nr:protein of unknown function [Pseudomonas sp. JV241A]
MRSCSCSCDMGAVQCVKGSDCAWLEGNLRGARIFLKILFKNFYITEIEFRGASRIAAPR